MRSVSARRISRISGCTCTPDPVPPPASPLLAPSVIAPPVLVAPPVVAPYVAPPPPAPAYVAPPPPAPAQMQPAILVKPLPSPLASRLAPTGFRPVLSSPSAVPTVADVKSLLSRSAMSRPLLMVDAPPPPPKRSSLFGGGGGAAPSGGDASPAPTPSAPVDDHALDFASASDLPDVAPARRAPMTTATSSTTATPPTRALSSFLDPRTWSRPAQIAGGVTLAAAVLWVATKAVAK